MGGSVGALAYGVGATEYAALLHSGLTFVEVPESIRFELVGELRAGVTAKDVMLYILAHHAKRQETLDRVMEFGGPGLRRLSPDERATLANMATECSAKAGVVEADEASLRWIVEEARNGVESLREVGGTRRRLRRRRARDRLAALRPMVATPAIPTAVSLRSHERA
jgi:3-isopropylmalate/(R)-2-methylmalate dehydratase large subunit